jgi:hypothetical protein
LDIYSLHHISFMQKYRWLPLVILQMTLLQLVHAQKDSIEIRIHPVYDSAGKFHRFWFGENYRKDWGAKVKLPVVFLSEFKNGLTPEKLGGGMQSKSLRLTDKTGKEWVIRSVEKTPELVLPPTIRQTFVTDVVDDATSAQHPFAAVIVPPMARVLGIPHTRPFVGYIAPDKNLGEYAKIFEGMVVLVEERAPFEETDNTEKILEKLVEDNDNTFHAATFLKARMLDVVLADWDRHADQWRWYDSKKGKGKEYLPIPRDRDQVASVTEGFLPRIFKNLYLMPRVPGFRNKVSTNGHPLYKSAFLNAYPAAQLEHRHWQQLVDSFVLQLTDSIIEEGVARLPPPIYALRHNQWTAILKARRDAMPRVMETYYRQINRVVDIRLTDKNEKIVLSDSAGGVQVRVNKISKKGEIEQQLMCKTYDPAITKEIRLYTQNGDDAVVIRTTNTKIRLRIITAEGSKQVTVEEAGQTVRLYGRKDNVQVSGKTERVHRHLGNDSLNLAFVPVNLYNLNFPLVTAAINADDGFLLGLGIKHVQQGGFRKLPYTSMQQLTFSHSFSTQAFNARFVSEWTDVFGKTDFIVNANAYAPRNTINFFGRGNETVYDKSRSLQYYRTRFTIYELEPALRWQLHKAQTLTIGPALQLYELGLDDNEGRFINNRSNIGSYDSSAIAASKLHAGIRAQYLFDKRNNNLLPASGFLVSLTARAMKGVNSNAGSYAQFLPEIAIYQPLNKSKSLVLSNRTGGGITLGKAAFYQSVFIGGHGNLLGFRQFRFAGTHSLYNNLELRVKLAQISNYILPGQLGLAGFFDVGRVWETGEASQKWHNGQGGGVYFMPAELAVFRFVMGHSVEGWYPYFTVGLRF